MLSCQEITRLLSEAQERSLTLRERMSLKLHVMMCSGCQNFAEQMHVLRQMARTYARRADEPAGKIGG